RSSLMSLIITFMFEPAKLQMNWARASGTSILRREPDDPPTPTPTPTASATSRSTSRSIDDPPTALCSAAAIAASPGTDDLGPGTRRRARWRTQSVAGGPVDGLAQQVGVAAVTGVLVDHVDDRPPKRVLAGVRPALVTLVQARVREMPVDQGDLVPVRRQGVCDRGL